MSAYYGHLEDIRMVIEEWSNEKNIEVPSKSTIYTAMTVPEFIAKKKIACQHDEGKPCYCDLMLSYSSGDCTQWG